jgi:UDP-2,3-diacylglucosamine hydrolase
VVVPEGLMTAVGPDAAAERDIALGIEVASRLGDLDIGQAVVVQQGLVLGVEAAEGTDQLLARCGALRRDGRGGVLVKLKKPRQERRADLPTIGPDTIHRAAEAGMAGIAVHAGNCLIIERAEAIAAADRAGLFVIGVAGR